MKTVRVVALKDHDYDQKPRKAGDVYEADPKFLTILTGLGRVKVVEVTEAPKPESHGRYNRRDMRAKDK